MATPVMTPAPVAGGSDNAAIPVGQETGTGPLWDIAVAVFGAGAAKAVRVADCEAGYKVSAGYDPLYLNQVNIGALGERSIFQIHPIHGFDPMRLSGDLRYAAEAAFAVSDGGTDWSPWTCGGA